MDGRPLMQRFEDFVSAQNLHDHLGKTTRSDLIVSQKTLGLVACFKRPDWISTSLGFGADSSAAPHKGHLDSKRCAPEPRGSWRHASFLGHRDRRLAASERRGVPRAGGAVLNGDPERHVAWGYVRLRVAPSPSKPRPIRSAVPGSGTTRFGLNSNSKKSSRMNESAPICSSNNV